MSVQAIRLENFMAFADTDWIELRPITLLFGRNSSGKSVIIRALRLLRQTLEQPVTQDADRPALRFNHEHGVRLGNYKETVHGKEEKRLMRFHFRCTVPTAMDRLRQEINQWRGQNHLPDIMAGEDEWLTLSLTFGYDPHREAELLGIEIGCCWQITSEPGTQTLLTAVWLDRETRLEVDDNWWLDTDLPAWHELDWQRATFTFPQNFLPQLIDAPADTLADAMDSLGKTVADFLHGIEYQPPVRPEPQRFYVFDKVTRDHWRQQGWGAFLAFLEGELDDDRVIQIDRWLQTLNLGREIRQPTRQYQDEDATVAKIELRERETGPYINLKNTGYGASQVIPIIIQSLTTPPKTANQQRVLLVIEQPELHLHVEAQGMLADFFIEMAAKAAKNFLLETHSEHLLLRFQRRIAETQYEKIRPDKDEMPPPPPANDSYSLEPKNLGLIFMTRSGIDTKLEFIEAGWDGQLIKPSPAFQDFFRYDYDDVEKLMSSVAKIRRQELSDGNSRG